MNINYLAGQGVVLTFQLFIQKLYQKFDMEF